ncbi:hypothetical protein SAMN05660690_1494 [Geodermatophilus telluris]|uniref:Uncharacterized protein n=1 Tax=Geodermatophilus telluris TaxID=1190417 RepID=A0A1G6LQ60_9ACTN|nr:hypothetical protein [Geodermatophilus telluris]SDC45227.1 hypothetical protein SAMN05660690_1494 [Geodermatophilus telluris]
MLQPTTDRYDYTRILRRTDPTIAPLFLADLDQAVDVSAEMTGDLTATLPVIADIWQQVSPDPDTTANMLGVLVAFSTTATAAGATTWHDVPTELITEFIHASGRAAGEVCRLRKNVVHGAYLALYDAGLFDDVSPAAGIDPVRGEIRTDERGRRRGNAQQTRTRKADADLVAIRTATHDEMLILRLATRLAVTSRTQQLPAAAVAICSSSATAAEAAQVLWAHVQTDATPQMSLPGQLAVTGPTLHRIAPRTVALDPWAAEALTDWRTERKAKDKPGNASRVASGQSVIYTGGKALDSDSARIAADQQIGKAVEIADLNRELGFSAGSLRLWAAARHVTEFASLIHAAAIAGIDPLELHRQMIRAADRRSPRCR